jgi:hypothetical protein
MPLSSKADAAFRQAAKKIIQRARQTGTPVVVWEEGHLKEIPGEEFGEWGSTHANYLIPQKKRSDFVSYKVLKRHF